MRPPQRSPIALFVSVLAVPSFVLFLATFSCVILSAPTAVVAKPFSMYDELINGGRAFLRMVEMFDTFGSVDSGDDDGDTNYDSSFDYEERHKPAAVASSKPSRSTTSTGGGSGGSSSNSLRAQERCQQPVRKGVCRALIARWSYDMATKQCTEFKFGGCDGNGNNFATLRQCQDMCGGL